MVDHHIIIFRQDMYFFECAPSPQLDLAHHHSVTPQVRNLRLSVSPPLNLQMSGIAFKMVQVCSSHTSREHSYRDHSDKQHMLAFITKHLPIPTCCGCRSCIERTIFFVPAQMVNPCRIMLRACACGVSPQAVELPPPPPATGGDFDNGNVV